MYLKHILMGGVLWITTDLIYDQFYIQGLDAVSLLLNMLTSAGVYFLSIVLLILLLNPNVRNRVRRYIHF